MEILLENEDPMLSAARETDKKVLDQSKLAKTYSYDVNLTVEPGRLMPKPLRNLEGNLGTVNKKTG